MGRSGKGKGTGGKGKHFYGGTNAKGYRTSGKAFGKGLNYWGEDDYAVAWGNEMDYSHDYEYEDWNYGYNEVNYMGNQMMLLERGQTKTDDDNNDRHHTQNSFTINTWIKVSGGRDSLRGTELSKPIATHNKYLLLIKDGDDSDGDDEHDTQQIVHWRANKFYNPNRRQRKQVKLRQTTQHAFEDEVEFVANGDEEKNQCSETDNPLLDDEVVRDAAVCDESTEQD